VNRRYITTVNSMSKNHRVGGRRDKAASGVPDSGPSPALP